MEVSSVDPRDAVGLRIDNDVIPWKHERSVPHRDMPPACMRLVEAIATMSHASTSLGHCLAVMRYSSTSPSVI
jgi:hypothetical protein